MTGRNPWVPGSKRKTFYLALGAAALAVPLWLPAIAAADECGALKVPGYTAKRVAGPAELLAFVSPEKERTEELSGAGAVTIMEFRTMATFVLNPKTKVAVMAPPPPKPPEQPDQAGPKDSNRFVNREPGKDGITTVSMGMITPKGKEWMIQTSCRPDGIWIERKIKTPRGLVTMHQADIKLGAIPATQFEVPSDYKIVQSKSQPAGKN